MTSLNGIQNAKTIEKPQTTERSELDYREELESIFSHHDQQVLHPSKQPTRPLSRVEESILRSVNTCLKNWHEPWKKTFLLDGREFRIVYDLMEGLLHYEYQITSSDSPLSSERTTAIAQAVARLIDYGNAILAIDLVIRANDDAFSETDPLRMTTIELFQAHTKAHDLREKLLNDYFKKDKPNNNANVFNHEQEQQSATPNGAQSPSTLQVPRGLGNSLNPQSTDGRLPKSPMGSATSINSLADNGRRTPTQNLPSPREAHPMDLNQSVEITHMMATIRSRTFSASHSSTTRLTLLPGVLSKIEHLISSPANSTKILQCFIILDALLDSIERLPEDSRDKEVAMVSRTLLRPLVTKVHVDDRDDLVHYQHAHWTTCLLSLVRLMGSNFNGYLKEFNNLADLGNFLSDYLFVVKRLLSSSSNRLSSSITGNYDSRDDIHYQSPIYPDCWIEMTLLACSTFLRSLMSLYQILRQVFSSNIKMWLAFIDCLIHFPLHESLGRDRLLLKQRQKLLADDIRRTSAEYVWISWESLSLSQKQQLLEDLMEPLLRASIALDSKHRSVLLPIFYDMMRCDYTVQYVTPRSSVCGSSLNMIQSQREGISLLSISPEDRRAAQAGYHPHPSLSPAFDASLPYLSLPQDANNEDGTVLTRFTHLIVGKLNSLVLDLKLGDEIFTEELCAALSGNLNPKYSSTGAHGDTSQFKSMARQTSDLISEFLQICIDCRHANRLVYKHLYLLCLFKLILFFRDKVDRIELYLSNLYKLSHLHHVAHRYVEAGYTLLEHAKSLPWSDSPLENHYRVITKFFNISQQQLIDSSTLKIFLYNTIMEYFDQGQNWEAAVPLCRELINHYEFKTYEYGKLAQQLDKMSSYFKNISDSSSRNYPEYFRVTFYGKGFPSCIKDMTVIYRGRAYEKLSDFQATIIDKYPDAKPLSTLSKPDSSLLEYPDARYLQINACSPIVNLESKFPGADLKKLREPLLNYYRHNCCDKFQFSRRVNRSTAGQGASDDNFANMWRERTTLTTNTFPGMLPFFPVYLIETSIVSPIESAIEDLERTNDRLATMVSRFKTDERHMEDVRLLGQLLLGVVDAAVNGGISKYEEAFFHAHNDDQQQQSSSSSSAAAAASMTSSRKFMTPPYGDENDYGAQTYISEANPANKVVTPTHQNKPLNVGNAMVNTAQVDKLKYLIAKQVPLLDEAIKLHRDRVAEVMRPQHEHLEASYKKLKHHITTKYYRYLPHDHSKGSSLSSSGTLRSLRSLARSPRSTLRASNDPTRLFVMDQQQQQQASSLSPSSSMRISRLIPKRMSDVGLGGRQLQQNHETTSGGEEEVLSSSIPYKQLANERRSVPFLTASPSPPLSSDSTRTRRESSSCEEANRHANGRGREYEEILDLPMSSPESSADQPTASEIRHIRPPKPAARSSLKLRLPFVDAPDGIRKEPLTTSVSDESQYMHLINCDKNASDDDDDDEEDKGGEGGEKNEGDEEEVSNRIVTKKPTDVDGMNLVSF